MILINVIQGSEAWYEARLSRFTASQFAKVMAGDSTATYKDLLTTTAGEVLSGQIEETYSNAIMERGIEMEPEARREYESIFDLEVETVGFVLPDEDDPLHEWVGVSPDGFVNGDGLLEIKCPLMKTHMNYIAAGKLPNDYKWQVQGQLMITGREWCDFMSYYPNLKPFIIRIYPDKEMIDQLRERLLQSVIHVKEIIKNYKLYDYLK